jgi:putative RecB family exonuclease
MTQAPTPLALPRKLTPSSISRWRVCGRRFLLEDVEQLPVDDTPTPHLCLGNSTHRALETFYRLTDGRLRTAETLIRLLDTKWQKARVGAFGSAAEEQACRTDAERMLRTYAETFDLGAAPIKLEQPFQLRLRNGLVIDTRVDRIDGGRYGGVRIIDYKSSRSAFQLDDRDLWQETATWVHILAVEAAGGAEVERYSWIYLDNGQEIAVEPERDDVEMCRERLVEALRGIYRDRDFDAQPGSHCGYCPVRRHCEDAAVADPAEPASGSGHASR